MFKNKNDREFETQCNECTFSPSICKRTSRVYTSPPTFNNNGTTSNTNKNTEIIS